MREPTKSTLWCTSIVLLALTTAVGCSDSKDELIDGAGGDDSDGGGAAAGGESGSSGSGGTGASSGDGDGDGDSGAGGTSGDGGVIDIPDELLLCNGEVCACADGIDNDSDGELDGFDTECTGANDDDESTFSTGIPGDNRDPVWQDCFFDGNSGAGDDDCRYHVDCLTGDLAEDDPDCLVSDECVEFCVARTPSGCDCFGCCTIATSEGEEVSVLIGGGCSEETLDECTTCIPTATDCTNECDRCELCLGKTIEDLPDDCTPPTGGTGGDGGTGGTGGTAGSDPPPYECDGGKTPCATQGDCSGGYYCSLGCCTLIPPQ